MNVEMVFRVWVVCSTLFWTGQALVLDPPAGTDFSNGWEVAEEGIVLGHASACPKVAQFLSDIDAFASGAVPTFPAQDPCVYNTHVHLLPAENDTSGLEATFWMDAAAVENNILSTKTQPSNRVHFLPRHDWKENVKPTYHGERFSTFFKPLTQFQVSKHDDIPLQFKFVAADQTVLQTFVVLDEPIPAEVLGDQNEPCEASCTCGLRVLQSLYEAAPEQEETMEQTNQPTFAPSMAGGTAAPSVDYHTALDEVQALFPGWSDCQGTDCERFFFAFVNFEGDVDPATSGDNATILEYMSAPEGWAGETELDAVLEYLFDRHLTGRGETCVSALNSCSADSWCFRISMVFGWVRKPEAQQGFLAALEQVSGVEAFANSKFLADEYFAACFGPPEPQPTLAPTGDFETTYDEVRALFPGWSNCEATDCERFFFAFINFYGSLDPATAGDNATILEYMSAPEGWPGETELDAVLLFLFDRHLAGRGETCVSAVNSCWSDVWCFRISMVLGWVKPESHQGFFSALQQVSGEEAFGSSKFLADEYFSACFGPPKRQLVVPLDQIPCACSKNAKGYATSEPGATYGSICHHHGTPFGTIVVGQSFVNPGGIKVLGHIETNTRGMSSSDVDALRSCVNEGSCSTTHVEMILDLLRAGPTQFDPKRYCDVWDSSFECTRALVSINPRLALEYTEKTGSLPGALVTAFSSHPAYMGSDDDSLVIQVATTDPGGFRSMDMDLGEDERLWDGMYFTMHRPDLSLEVTESNCHIGCLCADLHIAKAWDARPGSQSLFLPIEEIPCACTPLHENQRSRVIAEKVWSREKGHYSIRTTFELCLTGTFRFRRNNNVAVHMIKPHYSFVCDCHSNEKDCMHMCKLCRGSWGWTCDLWDGKPVLQKDSAEYQELHETCSL